MSSITSEERPDASRRRRGEPLFLIDLAVPRDVDPRANSRDNVRVLNEVAPIAADYRIRCAGPPARPAFITGPNNDLCQGATETYQTPAVAGADTYRWEVVGQPFVRTTSTPQVSISGYPFSTGAHTLRVRAQNGCGNSAWRSVTIYVLPNTDPTCGGCSGRFCF